MRLQGADNPPFDGFSSNLPYKNKMALNPTFID